MRTFRPIFIATHHKGGTVWINSTFRRIGRLCNFPFIHLNTGEIGWAIRDDKRAYMHKELAQARADGASGAIAVDYHATTPDVSDIPNAKGIHLVRDPRDMLISAIRYHHTSNEIWLDQPDPRFDGRSFRDQFRTHESDHDQIAFELDTFMGEELERMGAFEDRADFDGIFRTVKYEDLMDDVDLMHFHELAIHLGLTGQELIHAQQAFWNQSLFGGMRHAQTDASNTHVRDGRTAQWRDILDESTISMIHQRIGHVIERLGYPLS